MLRIGLVGPGSIADRRLAPALRDVAGAELWSVCSRDEGRAAEFAARHGARGPIFTDYEDMLADPRLDAVIVATPDRLHAAQALAAARAGKHVFVEKPMATAVEDADALVRTCRAAGVRLAVGYHLRFHAGLRALRERVVAGELGRLVHMRATWTFVERDPTDWRAGPQVGRWWALGAVGTHCLDLARWYLRPGCGDIERARALVSSPVHHSPHDETALLALRFASGATADIVCSVLFRAPRSIELYGDAGTARAEDVLGPHGGGRIVVNDQQLAYQPVDPYRGELQDFVDAVAHGRAPEVDGDEGLANVRWLCDVTSR